jgi:hypothetical protein
VVRSRHDPAARIIHTIHISRVLAALARQGERIRPDG